MHNFNFISEKKELFLKLRSYRFKYTEWYSYRPEKKSVKKCKKNYSTPCMICISISGTDGSIFMQATQ